MTRTPLFLFDIDGTLLHGEGAGSRAMAQAFLDLFGDASGFEGLGFGGLTDRRIIRSAAAAQGLTLDEPTIARTLVAYRDHMAHDCTFGPRFTPIAAACETTRALATLYPRALGLGTGNMADIAHLKVAHVGLAGLFHFGGYGDDAEDRAEMLGIGLARGLEILTQTREAVLPVVIGDTVRDVEAARAIGATVVAVATGFEDPAALRATEPDLYLEVLELDALLDWLYHASRG